MEESDRALSLGGAPVWVRVFSHLVDGHRHYGAVLQAPEPAAEPVPVLVYAHGGDSGVSLDEVPIVGAALGRSPDDWVVVEPSFTSEPPPWLVQP